MQKLANNDHIRHGPVVGGNPARAGHCLREQAQAKTSTAFRILWIQSIYGSDFCADLDLLNAVGAYPARRRKAFLVGSFDCCLSQSHMLHPRGSVKRALGALQMSIQDDPDLRKRQTRDREWIAQT